MRRESILRANQEINKIGKAKPDLYVQTAEGTGAILVEMETRADFRPIDLTIASDAPYVGDIQIDLLSDQGPTYDVRILHYEDGFNHSLFYVFDKALDINHKNKIMISGTNTNSVGWYLTFTYEIV